MMRPTWRAIVAGVLLLGVLSACGGSGATTVTAQFDDAAGLFEGNDVGVLGVRVGEVISITPRGDHVDAVLRIDPGVKIPADAGAVVVSRSVATDRYVELTPVYDSGAVLSSGATLAQDRTRTPVEFDDLLASLTEISDTVAGPDGKATAVKDILDAGARTLDGNGGRIAQGLHDLATVLSAADDSSAEVADTIDHLDTLTGALADNDQLVRRFTAQVADATELLDSEHESMERTFDALAAMVRAVAAFSRDHRGQVRAQVEDLTVVAGSLLDNRRRLEELVETLPLMMQNIDRAIDDKDRLTFRVRPGELVPGRAGAEILCASLPTGLCDALDLDNVGLFDLLAALAGVQGR